MRVLADFHHQALYHSLYMLFEERLGWELYRPIGPEWYHEGYWKVYDHPATVNQFLGVAQGSAVPPKNIHGNNLSDHEKLNLNYKVEDGIYYIHDASYKTTHRAIRLDKFKSMKFDIVISSIPSHVGPFNQLIAKFQPQAKHIFQIGNSWSLPNGVNNIMSSTLPHGGGVGRNIIFYHQEFDLNNFRYEPPTVHKTINSYIHYMKNPEQLLSLGKAIPEWTITTYGAGMQKCIGEMSELANTMINSGFTWHFKPGGDGFGHVIYSTYACGRPALIYTPHYKGCGANRLFEDQVTCIDTSKYPGMQLVKMIEHFSQPEEHAKMCENAYSRFCEVVNFDKEFEEIKKFLERLR